MRKIRKAIIICLILLIVFIPTAYAADNQTNLSLNSNDVMLSDSYYFDANVDDDLGNGSLDSPYKQLKSNRVIDNSTIYLNDGIYYGFNKEFSNLTVIGKNSEKTIIKNIQFDIKGSLIIQNVTLINSKITNNANITLVNSIFKDSSSFIGGVLKSNPNTFVTITNCTFLNNHANRYAGVIYSNNSNLNICNSSFVGNYANYYGGAIYCEKNSKLTIINTDFTNNHANNYAGVIYSSNSNLIIENSSFVGNYANYFGGAVYCEENSKLTLRNANFTNNQAKNDAGGAIYSRDSVIIANYLSISNSSSTFGGAITALNTNLNLTNFNAWNNKAKYRGGVIYSVYGYYIVMNSTFENNTASDGGALFIDSPHSVNVSSNKFIKNNALNIGGAVYIISNKNYFIPDNLFLNNSASFNNDFYKTMLSNLTIGNNNYVLINYNGSHIGNLPSSYDLRELNQTTSVKNQGSGGNCWAFAAIASLESCILKATGNAYDLSEENMKNLMTLYSNYGWKVSPNDGGYTSMGIGYLTSWLGAINESDDSYYESSALSPVLDSFIHVQNILFLKRNSYTDNDEIKRAIIEHGAVSTSVFWKVEKYANGENYYNYEYASGSNHAVVIVGWDDNYSKNNFIKKAPGDGAWIIKNSWGTGSGDGGYYYVSYYDARLAPINTSSVTYTFVLADSIKYDKNYQYDIPGMTDYLLNSSDRVWYKNKFTATDDEYLTAVSTYFQKETSWDLSIYVNNKLMLTQSGNSSASYSTIELNRFIILKKGDIFEIEFKITVDGDAGVPISEIASLNNLFYGENISYVSYDGKKWIDLFDVRWTYPGHTYNDSQVACIKAFTVLNKINSTIVLNITDKNNPVEITAKVLNQYGNPIKTGKVTFNIEGKDYIAKINNGFAKLIHIFNGNENKLIIASFSGAGFIESFSDITFCPVQVSITTSDMVSYYNKNSYSITLLDIYSKPVADKEVKFKINNLEYVAITNENGIAAITFNLYPNVYDVIIGFNSINFDNYNVTKKITIKSTISIPENTVYTYNSKYPIKLLNNNGNPLSNCKFKIVINGITNYAHTDSNGAFKYNINLKPGKHTITIINPKTGEKSTKKIKVVSRITQNKDLSMYYGAGRNYKVKVADDYGKVKKNLKISFRVNGKTYYRYTNEKGYAYLKISLKSGKYTITANYKGYKVSNKIRVKPTIITKSIAVKKGKTGKFTAKLLNNKGKILKYKTINFKFRGKTYKVKTNKYGIATLKIAKKYKITRYSIITSYRSEKIKNTIKIKR